MLVNNYSAAEFFEQVIAPQHPNCRVLNAGSKSTRYGSNCLNVDIKAGNGVDIVCDIHELPKDIGTFDAIFCNAVLQYCRNPFQVADQFHQVLKPGGYLFVCAPWIQGYCPDTPDKFRFSADGLRTIFSDFDIIDVKAGIRPGSALAYLAYQIAEDLTSNRYINFIARQIVKLLAAPLRGIRTNDQNKLAGSFYLIARKA